MIIIKRLVWDDWNVEHIARHTVTPDEVEEICKTSSQTEGAKKGRIRVTGRTHIGRIISAFLDPEPEEGVYYPVTAERQTKKSEKHREHGAREVNKQHDSSTTAAETDTRLSESSRNGRVV